MPKPVALRFAAVALCCMVGCCFALTSPAYSQEELQPCPVNDPFEKYKPWATMEALQPLADAEEAMLDESKELAHNSPSSDQSLTSSWNAYVFNYPNAWGVTKDYMIKLTGITSTGLTGGIGAGFGLLAGTGVGTTPAAVLGTILAVGGAIASPFLAVKPTANYPLDLYDAYQKDLNELHDYSDEEAAEAAEALVSGHEDVALELMTLNAENPLNTQFGVSDAWLVFSYNSFWCAREARKARREPRGKPNDGKIDHKVFPPQCLIWGAVSKPPSGGGSKGKGNSTHAPSTTDCVPSCTTTCPEGWNLEPCKCFCYQINDTIDVIGQDPGPDPQECKVWIVSG